MPQPLRRTAALALLALLPTACGDGRAAGGDGVPEGVSVVDSAGIRIVTNTGEGAWSDGDPWGLEEFYRVGGIDDPDAQFGLIFAVDVDADGNVYVADQQARDIRVYGPDGGLKRVIGGPGDGPGEFGMGFMGMIERDGEVWALDMMTTGLQIFTSEGERLRGQPMNPMGGIPMFLEESREGLVAQRRSMSVTPGEGGTIGGTGDVVVLLGAETPDTLLVLPAGQSIDLAGGMPQMTLFEPEPRWDVNLRGETVVGMDDVFSFTVNDVEGTPVRVIRRDVEPEPVNDLAVRAIKDAMVAQAEAFGAPPGMASQMFEGMGFAETMPLVSRVVLTDDGYFWANRTSTLAELSEGEDVDIQDLGSRYWDVFDPEGIYLGAMEMPGRFLPYKIIGDELWGVDRDELGVASVVGMRILR